jgi:hypothetical protein
MQKRASTAQPKKAAFRFEKYSLRKTLVAGNLIQGAFKGNVESNDERWPASFQHVY